ncbi:MAG: hypothetical protein IPH35_10875 [Rhodoferax sp.]|nr:hypothetical protein [Rhodoferax sp.]
MLADASWYLDPWPAVDAALENGAVLAGFVHDLLPLQQPEWFKPELPHVLHPTCGNSRLARASLLLTPRRGTSTAETARARRWYACP